MALPAFRGIFPLMRLLLLLLFMLELSYGESTTDAPTRSHRNQQRLQQLQQAQDGIDIGPGHGSSYSGTHHRHHLRHEQHLRAELSGSSGNRQPPPPPPPSSSLAARQAELEQLEAMLPGPGQQHHLRHHNRHHAAWEQRVFPALRHQQHRMAPAMATSSSPFGITTTTTTTRTTPATPTTDAPLMRVGSNLTSASSRYFDRDGIYPAWTQPRSTRAPNWQQLSESDESGDDDDDDDDDEDYEDDVDEELAKQMPRYSFFKQKMPEISSNDDDYDAYDQSDVESNIDNDNDNRHPSVASGHSKAAAKRGVFDWFFKRDKEKVQPVHVIQQQQQQTRPQSQVKGQAKPKPAATEKPNSVYNVDPRMNEDSFEGFTETEWNKIEYNHHLKQQKHQKELQALRESNRNRPLITAAVGRGAIDNEVRLSGALKSTTVSADAHMNMNNYSPNYIPGTLTHQKVERLGNSEAVLKSRRPYEKSHASLASAHWHQVMKSKCQEPQQRCVRIDSDPSKIYMPHCTILHRCAEDSGCCHDPTEICAPKIVHDVELPFIVKSPRNHHTITELLTFVNHTECHCIQRSTFGTESVNGNLGVRQATIFNCNCPQYFEKILQNDGQCRCDCSSSNYDCDFRKRGSEHFSMVDRKCIQQGRCKPPTCQFGKYMERQGRCPNENDQMHNQPNPYNPRSLS